jgi:hypothetical protein
MIKITTAVLTVSLSLFLAGCPARPRPLSQPEAIVAEGAYVHEKSGMTLPLTVGDYRRTAVLRYDQQSLDVSAEYDLYDGRGKIAATVYVYPAPSLLSIGSPTNTVASARVILTNREFEARKQEILHAHPGGKLMEDTEISIPIGGATRVGRIANFEYEHNFAGQYQMVRSHLCMFNFVGGEWALKYRITYPKNLETTSEIDALLQGIPWNVPQD